MLYTSQQTEDIFQQKFAHLLVDLTNHVLTLTLHRPEKKNALNPTLLNEFAYAMHFARCSDEVWVVVLKASGDVWCAGMDLRALAGQLQASDSTVPPPKGAVVLGDLMANLHKPCIAQVHAPVYAGGFLIVGGCTHVITSEKALFSLPEVKRGLFPFQVMSTLVQLMPARKALDWCMRGKTLTAHEAHEVGLVTEVVVEEALVKAVKTLVDDLLQYSPTAIRMGLEAYHALLQLPQSEQHTFLYAQFAAIQQTADAKEGMAAFNEKRKPNWTGR
ncbi:MAG: enoyl-CoA hydratase-related protein [Spirosomataceae bacterium]